MRYLKRVTRLLIRMVTNVTTPNNRSQEANAACDAHSRCAWLRFGP